jgi:deoxyribodipyrimidine photo-lyase
LLQDRVRALNEAPAAQGRRFVLLWLQGQRRLRQNLAYAYAQRRANELQLPLCVYEGLRADYPGAGDRFHRFVLEGAFDNAADCLQRGLAYAFFLERPGSPRGALLKLSNRAALMVTDWLPAFIHPEQTRRLAARAGCPVEVVDAAGVAPLSAFPQQELAARTLRPKLHRLLPRLLQPIPEVPALVEAPARLDWGFEPLALPCGEAELDAAVASCAIDHSVPPVAAARGGTRAALSRLRAFLREGLPGYAEGRNQPAARHASWLSPYLHFGHLGALEIALAVRESGAPQEDRAAFLEELLVRRELALNFAARQPRHSEYDAAPAWARRTLEEHERDPRPALYDDAALDQARTADEVWNAAQRQLRAEGRIHGYLRMLWAKLILTWSPTAREAHRRIAWLNDRYALDGRDAVSATNFLWIFGLHDRPFPERAIFGTVRSMTSASALRKLELAPYLYRWAKI